MVDSTRRGWASALLVLLVCFAFSMSVAAGLVQDTDSDGIPDVFDNCSSDANGPNDGQNQTDTDGDGIGNACDCDYTQDGIVLGDDVIQLFGSFNMASDLHDNTGDGFVLGDDIFSCFGRFSGPPGPGPTAI